MKQRSRAVLAALTACAAALLNGCANAGTGTPATQTPPETPLTETSSAPEPSLTPETEALLKGTTGTPKEPGAPTETATPTEPETRTETANPPGIRIEYAENTVAVENPNAFQERVDEMVEQAPRTMGLQFKNDAYSADGVNFDCYIANPARNERDMFLTIYADAELTERVYLSGLVAPGYAFKRIALERPLPEGDHTVYVAFSQVEELDGQQTMRAQALVAMDFHVKFPGMEADAGGNAAQSGSMGAQA